ncbi:MAG: alpha/beta fold hydrolase [Planctomycetaceae bacterium]
MRVPCGGHEVVADVHLRDAARPPVLFLHGMLTSTAVVRDLFDDPAEASWISVSLPGHQPGRLAPGTPPAQLDADFFAEYVEAAVTAVVGRRRRVVAVGWSTGGFAALNLAIRRPERVAAVASLAGFASGDRVVGSVAWLAWLSGVAPGAAFVRGGLWMGGRMPWLHDLVLATCAADRPAARRIDADTRRRLWREFAGHDPVALASVLAALRRLDLADRLGEIGVPAWIVAGERDPLVPPAEARRIAAAIPRSRLTVYDAAGHLFFHEWTRLRPDFAAWRTSLPATEP